MPAKGTLQTWHCVACGKPFKCKQYRMDRRYCSPACRPESSLSKRSPEALKTVSRMWAEGATYFAIAKEVGAADRTVARWIEELCKEGKLKPRAKTHQRLVAERKLSDRKVKAHRKCLTCEGQFLSDGPYNRICDTCREGSAWKSGCSYWFAA